MKILLLTTMLTLGTAGAGAQQYSCNDTTVIADERTAVIQDSDNAEDKKKRGLINRIIDYFADSNKEKPYKKFDFSIIGGPHYSTDTKLGLGIVATGLYRTDKADSLLPRSNVAIYGDITTANYYKIGVRGNHIFPHDRGRIVYDVAFDSFKSDFWGIGFDNGDNDTNKSRMDRCQVNAEINMLWRCAPNLYIGPALVYDFAYADNVERPELLNGMNRRTWNIGAGISLVYDSRDVITNPHKGVYLNLSQYFRPAFIGNEYAFSTTDLHASAYTKVWKGGIIAGDLRGTLNFGNPSWGMMALLGSSYSMRGYYEGRYRDKHKIEIQVELRQHLWGRNSMVIWAGAGTVFNKFSAIQADRLLPNFGIGYRWEFKKDVNIRLDYGIGKSGQSGFIFNINEAF